MILAINLRNNNFWRLAYFFINISFIIVHYSITLLNFLIEEKINKNYLADIEKSSFLKNKKIDRWIQDWPNKITYR